MLESVHLCLWNYSPKSLYYYHCFFFAELFCLLNYGCPQSAFPKAVVVVFMLLFAFAGAQWRIASALCTTACSATGVLEASKVRS